MEIFIIYSTLRDQMDRMQRLRQRRSLHVRGQPPWNSHHAVVADPLQYESPSQCAQVTTRIIYLQRLQ